MCIARRFVSVQLSSSKSQKNNWGTDPTGCAGRSGFVRAAARGNVRVTWLQYGRTGKRSSDSPGSLLSINASANPKVVASTRGQVGTGLLSACADVSSRQCHPNAVAKGWIAAIRAPAASEAVSDAKYYGSLQGMPVDREGSMVPAMGGRGRSTAP
jgi:hypothetical protein